MPNLQVVIANEQVNAMYFIRLALARAITTLGHQVTIWDINKKSPFDVFDELKPDVIFLQSYNLNEAVIKCIKEHPELKIVMRVSDWSPWRDSLDPKYPVLKAGKKEVSFMEEIRGLPNKMVCHIHHFEEYLSITHGNWIKEGYNLISVPNCADIFDYTNGVEDKRLKSDLCMVGGYWPYKAQTLDKYILPLLSPFAGYSIKIFGNSAWPSAKYCGFLPNGIEKHVLKSAKICLNVHELHSENFGYDAITRPYNCMANKCLVISDYVEGLANRFTGMIHCQSPGVFKENIDYYLKNQEKANKIAEIGYREVIKDHTAYDRLEHIFNALEIPFDTSVKATILEKLCHP